MGTGLLNPVSCPADLSLFFPICCCCSLVTKSCPTLCDPMDTGSTLGFPAPHHLLEFAQVHAHWISDAIQLSHPLSLPSPSAFNLSQHQGLFQWVGSSHQAAKVLELQLQHQSFQWIFRADFLYDWLVWFSCCPGESQESSPTPQFESINLQCSAFFMVQLSHWYMTTGKTIGLTNWTLLAKWCLCFLIFCLGL